MLITLDNQSPRLRVTRYGREEIWVGERRITGACVLSANHLDTDWPATGIDTLTLELLQPLLQLQPRIMLIGAVAGGLRPAAALRREVEARGIALECMELGAACRTYNVLSQEAREVVAGLITAPQ